MELDHELAIKPEGVMVQAKDGRLFFLPEAELERLAVKPEHTEAAVKMRAAGLGGGGTIANPQYMCATLINWMEHHNPNTMAWRKVCLKALDQGCW